jgi:hypothetical protein
MVPGSHGMLIAILISVALIVSGVHLWNKPKLRIVGALLFVLGIFGLMAALGFFKVY